MIIGTWRMLRTVVHTLQAVLIVVFLFPFCSQSERRAHIRDWSRTALRIFGVQLEVEREPGAEPQLVSLLVANHVSWLDILAIWAVADTQFVAKVEVMGWPVFGWLAKRLGVIFVDRSRRAEARDVGRTIAATLAGGKSVCIFPEGTTTDGGSLSPFRAPLFQVAIDCAVPVQLVAVSYARRDRTRAVEAAFVGEMTLVQSIWQLATGGGMIAELAFLAPIDTRGVDRRTLALAAQSQLGAHLSAEVVPGKAVAASEAAGGRVSTVEAGTQR
jgi:1-acyl-sn-glycerol-3-phosphate acyltransferase